MVSARAFLLAAVATAVSAVPCSQSKALSLPQVGKGVTELASPPANLVLKKIAIGHGVQNYTCSDTTADAKLSGALAILYDVTNLHPGTGRTAFSQRVWDTLPSRLLWKTPLPLNQQAGSEYGVDPKKPFPDQPESIKLKGFPAIKFLGQHYFDALGTPMFDLKAAGLKASVVKTGEVEAPAAADKGILGTGAAAWLHLDESNKGLSNGLSLVYRVITAGGVSQACSVVGAGQQSVPYATYYWFYG